ncbi:MAG: choice-of-anchor D domain-containing protein [Candidatus Acidiferrum sp.]
MAQARAFSLHFAKVSRSRAKNRWKTLILAGAVALAISFVPSAHAQTQQPFLIAIQTQTNTYGAVTFVRDDSTGSLTLVPNSAVTFTDGCEPFFIEPKDRFLFGPCGSGLSMYTLNGSTGILAEVPTSPFTESLGNLNWLFPTESTGQYVYILKALSSGTNSPNSLILDTFQIDPNTPALIPTSSQTLPVAGLPAGAVNDPNGHGFAVLLNQDQGGAQPVPVLYTVTFDPSSGLPIIPTGGTSLPSTNAWSMQIGPKGQYMSVIYGPNAEFINVYQLSTTNFQQLSSSTLNIGAVNFFADRGAFYDPSDTLIYVQSLNTNPDSSDYSNFQVLDLATLTDLPTSPVSFEQGTQVGCSGQVDPYGPFVFCAYSPSANENSTGLIVYQVDPITGLPSQPGPISMPFDTNLSVFPVVLTATSTQQSSSAPALAWSPSSLTFSSTQTGQSSEPMALTFKNIGTLPATFSSAILSGPNAADFSKNDECTPAVTLQPSSTCTISITYSPSAVGTSQATLTVTDNAVGSPQIISLTGTAVAPPPPTPGVSLNPPGTLSFPGTTTQGTTSAPQDITLTNTGNGTLHVTGIAVSGFNANDFTLGVSNCLGAVAASANCSIPVTFAPLAAGIRTATLNITDDAADSPQTVALIGTATPAVTIGAAPSGSTSATVSAGQTAQFGLQITPGAGYTGIVSLSCSGAPQGATCQLPSTLQITNGNATPFLVTVTTSGGAGAATPFSNLNLPRAKPSLDPPAAPGLITGILLLILLAAGLGIGERAAPWPKRLTLGSALSTVALLIMLGAMLTAAGCGGGSSGATTPPPIITPQGMSNIVVTPAAKSANGQPLQLQPIQLTLTVN